MGLLAEALADAIAGTINRTQFEWTDSVIRHTWMAYGAYHLNQTQDLMWILLSVAKNVSLSLHQDFSISTTTPPRRFGPPPDADIR